MRSAAAAPRHRHRPRRATAIFERLSPPAPPPPVAGGRGRLRLYLDSASPAAWDALIAPTGMVYGITTNPTILLRDGAQGCTPRALAPLARAAFAAGARELQLQATGTTAAKLLTVGLDLAALDARIVVKVCATRAGLEAAARLKAAGVRVTLTGLMAPETQIIAAAGLGAEFAAPYCGRITDAGRDGVAECAAAQAILDNLQSPTRLLVASVRSPADVAALAAAGCDTFALSPAVLAALAACPATDAAAAAFEEAALQLGAEP